MTARIDADAVSIVPGSVTPCCRHSCAKALRISAEALYVQAGILEERYGDSDVPAAILADAHLAERQKQVLLELYEAYRRESEANGTVVVGVKPAAAKSAPAPASTSRTRTARRAKPSTAKSASRAAAARDAASSGPTEGDTPTS